MSTAGQRVCFNFSRFSLYHHIFINTRQGTLRSCATRTLSMTSQLSAKSRKLPDGDEETSKPIKFSTSKASHQTWNVDRSLGSTYQRPWWKVLPISIFGVGFLLWCIFRKESEIDETLEKHLFEHLPGLLSDEEEEIDKSKP
ncbi:protein ccsmst1-like [Xyrauchen texanus]|uniref:protein ccsmst1-like n=1 Tax=Xyrauchen texanus TaxID=154827 RepID=UPI002241D0F4|nr:protein ccsmst1-like [Xyrauchen texanus]